MEDFLREKLSHGGEDFTPDWADFEPKLERAMFFKQVRVGAAVSVLLIVLSISFFGGSSFSRFGPALSDTAKEILYYGTGSHSEFDKVVVSNESEKMEDLADSKEKLQPEEGNIVIAFSEKDEEQESLVEIEKVDAAKETLDVDKQEEASIGAQQLSAEGQKSGQSVDAEVPVNTVAGNLTDEDRAQEMVATDDALELAVGEDADVAEEEGLNEKVVAPASVPVQLAGVQSKSAPVQSVAALSLVPDGKDGANFKPNVKPTELMFDMKDVSKMELRTPVVPPQLKTGEPKEAYVSPMQEKKPWSYSIKVYPNYTYRKFVVAPDKMTYIHRDFVDQVEVSETGGFSLNVGFEASKRIGAITYLNAGIEYISYKTEANFDFMNYRDAVINSQTGEIQSYHIRNEAEHIMINDANRYHYLNLPVSIAYKPWVSDHVRINIEGGASYMYFIKASGKSLDYQTLEIIDISEREYRNNIGSVFMKIGATYHVSSQFSLGFEPTVVYFTNTIYTEKYPFEVIPYSMGLNFKLQLKLN